MPDFITSREGHEIIRRVLNLAEIVAISMIYNTAAMRAKDSAGEGYTLSALCEDRLSSLLRRCKADGGNRF